LISERTLVDLLAERYREKDRSYTVVDAAGLNVSLIALKDRPIDNWNSILKEAKSQRKLQALVAVAANQYPDDRVELEALLETWLAVIPPQPKAHAPRDEEILIGQELHWDHELPATTFLGMIRRNTEECPWRILAIQGPKQADLNSLVNRFEKMCEGVTTSLPLLYTRISLGQALSAPQSLSQNILFKLRASAQNSGNSVIRQQAARLMQGWEEIEGSSAKSARPGQLALKLTNCLGDVGRQCTVVLLLSEFEQLGDSPSYKWLRDTWLMSQASTIEGLVTVIAGESGLGELAGQVASGIYCFDHLPPLPWQDFADWARKGYGFAWFKDEMAQKIHANCQGDIRSFTQLLQSTKIMIDIGMPLDRSPLLSPQ
jgi:hypothetical protein